MRLLHAAHGQRTWSGLGLGLGLGFGLGFGLGWGFGLRFGLRFARAADRVEHEGREGLEHAGWLRLEASAQEGLAVVLGLLMRSCALTGAHTQRDVRKNRLCHQQRAQLVRMLGRRQHSRRAGHDNAPTSASHHCCELAWPVELAELSPEQ